MATKGTEIRFPTALRCVLCNIKISMIHDSFMVTCCESKLVCNQCLEVQQGKMECGYCRERISPFRVKGQFIKGIVDEINTGLMDTKQETENLISVKDHGVIGDQKGDMLNRIYELVPTSPNVRVRQVSHILHSTIWNYKHNNECKPYQNIEYISEIFVKFRKIEGNTITVHDILAYFCTFCGHGPINGLKLPNGETRGLNKHSMHKCSVECCGRYLDRRYLQYVGGRCECRVAMMNQLGIRPATEEENEWRRDLFMGKDGGTLNRDVKSMFADTFNRLKIFKPQLLVWYIMSKGDRNIKEMMRLSPDQRDKQVLAMVEKLNGEYGRNVPIQ